MSVAAVCYDSYSDITADEEEKVLNILKKEGYDSILSSLIFSHEEESSKNFTPHNYKRAFHHLGGLARPAYRFSPNLSVRRMQQILDYLRSEGYDTIISLSDIERRDREDVLIRFFWLIRDTNNKFFHFTTEDHVETPDYIPPGPERLEVFNGLVKKETDQGRRVAVYCGAGFGRTGFHLASHVAEIMKGPFCSVEDAEETIMRQYHIMSVLEMEQAESDKVLEKYLNRKYPANALQKIAFNPIERALKTPRRFMLKSVLIPTVCAIGVALKVSLLVGATTLAYESIRLFMT